MDRSEKQYKYDSIMEKANFNFTMFIGMMIALILSIIDNSYFGFIFDVYEVFEAYVILSLIFCGWFLVRNIYFNQKAKRL